MVDIRRIRELLDEADFSLVKLVAAISSRGTRGRREGKDAAETVATGGGGPIVADTCGFHPFSFQNGLPPPVSAEYIYIYTDAPVCMYRSSVQRNQREDEERGNRVVGGLMWRRVAESKRGGEEIG